MTSTERLYCMPDHEEMYVEPNELYDNEIAPYLDEHPQDRLIIQEYSVHPANYHLPSADAVLEWIAEWTADNGEVDDSEPWDTATRNPEVVSACDAMLDALASKVHYRMANDHLCDRVVTWNEEGEPLLDGKPL